MKQTLLLKIPTFLCDLYLRELERAQDMKLWTKYTRRSLQLYGDDKDISNVLYSSKRSSMKYIYLQSKVVLVLNKIIMAYLYLRTGLKFGGINDIVAPINVYNIGDSIKEHRDRNMLKGGTPLYVAVLCLEDRYKGGEFFYNTDCLASKNGKDVLENLDTRTLITLKKGDLFILKNDNSIHGTLEVIDGKRITTGFRTIN